MVVILLLTYGVWAALFWRWQQQNLHGASMKGWVNLKKYYSHYGYCCMPISNLFSDINIWILVGVHACIETKHWLNNLFLLFHTQCFKVAAMFKIGNSCELPTIPDNLSEEGKDFVRLCLQRDPFDRPSAGQLLQHPFVKSASLERLILNADSSESPSAIINAMRSLVKSNWNVLTTCVFNSLIYSIILCIAAFFFWGGSYLLCCLGSFVELCGMSKINIIKYIG